MWKPFSAILLFSFFSGCNGDIATFDKPLPPASKAEAFFPKHLRGRYLSRDGSFLIRISSNMICEEYAIKMARADLDSASYLSGDTLIDRNSGNRQVVAIKNDSLFWSPPSSDTVFAISGKGILKKFKGYYFMNQQVDEGRWRADRLQFSKGMLITGHIADSSEITALKTYAEGTQDTLGYIFRPTQKEFKAYLKHDGFKDRDTFYRIGD